VLRGEVEQDGLALVGRLSMSVLSDGNQVDKMIYKILKGEHTEEGTGNERLG
jgi:hypothetical protein